MALTKNDCLLLLGELERSGIDTREATNKLVSSRDLSLDVVRFINQHRQLDLTKFYEKLRKSYNNKKSKLYTNIVKDIEDTTTVLTTLSSLQLQILLTERRWLQERITRSLTAIIRIRELLPSP